TPSLVEKGSSASTTTKIKQLAQIEHNQETASGLEVYSGGVGGGVGRGLEQIITFSSGTGLCPGSSCLLSAFGPISETVGGVVAMFLSAVTFAKSKSKTILVKMLSQAGTGYSFNTKRSRLREKLTLLHYDPIGVPRKGLGEGEM
uniref:Large ribosomal subunit protein bL33m n=1 Tax=Lynx canadensis TaxID=61383 RepID=A0A667GIA9_LYNCA